MCAGYNQGPYLDPKISAGDFLFRAYDFHGQSNCLCVLRCRVSWRAFNLYPSSLVGNGPGFMLEVITICQRSCFCSCFCCLPPFLDSYGCHLIPVYIFSLVLLPTPIALSVFSFLCLLAHSPDFFSRKFCSIFCYTPCIRKFCYIYFFIPLYM